MVERNARIGLALFGVYLLLYGGFVLLNTFAPQVMETPLLADVNAAVLYGFGLIAAAMLLAIVYGAVCRDEPPVAREESEASA